MKIAVTPASMALTLVASTGLLLTACGDTDLATTTEPPEAAQAAVEVTPDDAQASTEEFMEEVQSATEDMEEAQATVDEADEDAQVTTEDMSEEVSETPAEMASQTEEVAAIDDLPPIWEELNLTESQQLQVEQIQQDTEAQIRTVLTSEQTALLGSFSGEDREAFRALHEQLNLTATQRDQIQEFVGAAKQQLNSLLTPEQLDTLEETAASAEGLDLIDSIRDDFRAEFRSLLNTQQLATLDEVKSRLGQIKARWLQRFNM